LETFGFLPFRKVSNTEQVPNAAHYTKATPPVLHQRPLNPPVTQTFKHLWQYVQKVDNRRNVIGSSRLGVVANFRQVELEWVVGGQGQRDVGP